MFKQYIKQKKTLRHY